jgi:carboxymethylenebutenolidase
MSVDMGAEITLTAADGHQLSAYTTDTGTASLKPLVLIQEIFGINSHIRGVAEDYAVQGFWVIAPALFDRVQPHLELGYTPADMTQGMRAATQIGFDNALQDVAAAINYAQQQRPGSKVGVLGYCLGGSLAWLAATRLNPAAVVCYYGGRIAQFSAEQPRCPVMLHFGRKDPHIPPSEVETIKRTHPDLPAFLYDAGHGFNCDQRADYEPASAKLAHKRTLEFLLEWLS